MFFKFLISLTLLYFSPWWWGISWPSTPEIFDKLAQYACSDHSWCQKSESEKILGKNYSNSSEEECKFFPIDSVFASGFVPIKNTKNPDLKIWAGASVVIDADSGTILHYDDGRKRTQIASLTKIMTAVLAMENIKDLNETVTITEDIYGIPGTIIGCPRSGYCVGPRLVAGEKVRALDLVKGALMNSANDAATALAVHIAGTPDKFVQMMNEKAKSLGLKDTNFCTPSGLEIDGEEEKCYSSAYDIARIAAYSLKHEKLWKIMQIPEDQFTSLDGQRVHTLKNTDLLLDNLPNCLGGKTGFTPLAGKSLMAGVSDASRKHRIIAVILNDENRWEDMKQLVEWSFNNYIWQ